MEYSPWLILFSTVCLLLTVRYYVRRYLIQLYDAPAPGLGRGARQHTTDVLDRLALLDPFTVLECPESTDNDLLAAYRLVSEEMDDTPELTGRDEIGLAMAVRLSAYLVAYRTEPVRAALLGRPNP